MATDSADGTDVAFSSIDCGAVMVKADTVQVIGFPVPWQEPATPALAGLAVTVRAVNAPTASTPLAAVATAVRLKLRIIQLPP